MVARFAMNPLHLLWQNTLIALKCHGIVEEQMRETETETDRLIQGGRKGKRGGEGLQEGERTRKREKKRDAKCCVRQSQCL